MNEKSIKEKLINMHEVIDKIRNDKRRPKYHFCVPFDLGFPADPNAPFYYNGKYHLMYIYESRVDSYRWAHIVSKDLLHWTHLPDALIPDELDGGIYSGGIYLSDDEYAYIVYWALGKNNHPGGIRIARSKAPDFIYWEKMPYYVIKNSELGIALINKDGKQLEIGSADPSNIWKNNNKYYLQLGNLCLLNKYRERIEQKDPLYDDIKGDHAYLLESDDLINWKYVHDFYKRNNDDKFTGINDDCMCPFFGVLPLGINALEKSQKYIQLFLSHNKGVQYYIGDYDKDNNKFIIASHGRMSFVDNALFAPEAFYAKDGRLISFYWQRDNQDDNLKRELEKGWSGVHSLPRELFLNEDNTLGIAPIRELRNLRIPVNKSIISPNKIYSKKDFDTDCCEIVISHLKKKSMGIVGVKVAFGDEGYCKIYIHFSLKVLVFDLINSKSLGRVVRDEAPITDEKEQFIDIFIDKCIIEVFVSNKQAISRQVFEINPNNRIISFINSTNSEIDIDIYEMMPTN